MQFQSNFECLSFDPFSLQENFMSNESDPFLNIMIGHSIMSVINQYTLLRTLQ